MTGLVRGGGSVGAACWLTTGWGRCAVCGERGGHSSHCGCHSQRQAERDEVAVVQGRSRCVTGGAANDPRGELPATRRDVKVPAGVLQRGVCPRKVCLRTEERQKIGAALVLTGWSRIFLLAQMARQINALPALGALDARFGQPITLWNKAESSAASKADQVDWVECHVGLAVAASLHRAVARGNRDDPKKQRKRGPRNLPRGTPLEV